MADVESTHYDFLVYGARGFFGTSVVHALKTANKSFVIGTARLEDRAAIAKELDLYTPKYVVSAAGLAGNPNIVRLLSHDSASDWFETHQQEGIRGNVLAALNLVDLCFTRNIHCTTFGTGFLYTYDEAHPLGSGIGFKETDEPNYKKTFYVHTRLVIEDLLKSYPNCLNLRPNNPTTSLPTSKSLISKLVTFKKIVAIPTSISVMDDLWPLIIPMCEQGLTGTFNFTNPGAIDNNEIMLLYKKHVDPSKTWDLATEEEVKQILAVGRPACELDVSKLKTHFPELPDVRTAVENMMIRIAEQKRQEAEKQQQQQQ